MFVKWQSITAFDSVCLCLSCVCGVDVCICCRKWCKGCGGPEEQELLPEDYEDRKSLLNFENWS